MSLEVDEFQAQLLEHVPPNGLRPVHEYGLYAGDQHQRLDVARKLLGQPPLALTHGQFNPADWQELCAKMGNPQAGYCPACKAKLLVVSPFWAGRDPPLSTATAVEMGGVV